MAISKSWNLSQSVRNADQTEDWIAPYPNPADLNFNYRKLLDNSPSGIAENKVSDFRIAIIGAGIAGLTAARELLRSGFRNIDLYEATDRYGGRHYTRTIGQTDTTQYTVQEGGAMRMPPFLARGETNPKNGISILSYYLNEFDIATEAFPNPGSSVAKTGIYYNEGYASGEKEPKMLIWEKTEIMPPSEILKTVFVKWKSFVDRVAKSVGKIYPTGDWQEYWKSIVTNYWDKTFRDVVMLEPIYGKEYKGNWGGCGMTEEEATIFYIIGAGDGSWGAFFNLSFLYVYRTFIHGFSSDLQLIQGLFDCRGNFVPGPDYGNDDLRDTIGNKIPSPHYLGVTCFDDCLLFEPVNIPGIGKESLYRFANKTLKCQGINLLFNSPVTRISKTTHASRKAVSIITSNENVQERVYQAVILTVPTWQTQMQMEVHGFSTENAWPFNLQTYLKRAHWEPCCKIFIGLKEAYWEQPRCKIPQVIATDSFLQDIYGVKVSQGGGKQTGTLLLSYTWWRDANKLVCYDDDELVDLAINGADRILLNSRNINQKISPYLDRQGGFVIHWEKMPSYKGAARLYDERTWNDTQVPMGYNQAYSSNSALYFAGESYGVDAGWTEPAFRGAIDAVLHICNNNQIPIITKDFNFETDYPKYDLAFDPSKH